MRAGAMRYMLQILQPTTVENDFGEQTVVWSLTNTVHAERVKATGRRAEEVSEHFPDYSVQFNIRDAHTISENWRVQQLGGHLYTVVAIIPNINRGMLTLNCERVNE